MTTVDIFTEDYSLSELAIAKTSTTANNFTSTKSQNTYIQARGLAR
jgi:hypothetical protein